MFNINHYSDSLLNKDGIYFSKHINEISYPKDGNDNCFNLEDTSFWFKHRNNCIASLVKKYAKDGVFFDIGGGNGFVCKGLENNDIQSLLQNPSTEEALEVFDSGQANHRGHQDA